MRQLYTSKNGNHIIFIDFSKVQWMWFVREQNLNCFTMCVHIEGCQEMEKLQGIPYDIIEKIRCDIRKWSKAK